MVLNSNCEISLEKSNKDLDFLRLEPDSFLKCDDIPKVSLSKKYVSKFSNGWNKWNGLEVKGQIKDGIESMVKNCYNEKNKKSNNLKNNYCNLAKDVNDLNNSNLYKDLCLA